jgi:phospholipase C
MAKPNIEHVVTLMMENRSFDHMLGLLPGVNGIAYQDPDPAKDTAQVNPNYYNLAKPGDPTSTKYMAGEPGNFTVPSIDINRGFGGPGHSFPAATIQLQADAATSADVKNPAALDGFIYDYATKELFFRKNPSAQEIGEPMTTFSPSQVPVISQLALQFCVCDNWFSEVPGPTEPNRLFTHAATSMGYAHNVWTNPITAKTIYENLEAAGHDWAFFFVDQSDSDSFPALKGRTNIQSLDAFYQAAKAGTLPSYSFLCPQMLDGKDGSKPNSQHAPYDVRLGELLMADVYEALRNGPLWNSSVLIVTYDEHGGYYDHVSPPQAPQPDQYSSPTAWDQQQAKKNPKQNAYLIKPNMNFDFTRLGLRVPAVLVTPWVIKGTVDSNQYQHTSIMATLRDLFGAATLNKRDASARSFLPTLSKLSQPRTDAPTTLTRPPIPAATPADTSLPLTEREQSMIQSTAQLDGHKDSGKSFGDGKGQVPMPRTRGDAAAYVPERRQAHIQFHRERRRKATYAVRRDKSGKYHWSLSDENGNVVATSPKPLASQQEAEAHIAKIRDVGPFAKQVNHGKKP